MLSAHRDWLARSWIASTIHHRANGDKQNGFPFRFGYRRANFIHKLGGCSKKYNNVNVLNGELFKLSKLKIFSWKSYNTLFTRTVELYESINPLRPNNDQSQTSHCNIKRSWELRTWSLKFNSIDILTAFPHYFCKKCVETQKENL